MLKLASRFKITFDDLCNKLQQKMQQFFAAKNVTGRKEGHDWSMEREAVETHRSLKLPMSTCFCMCVGHRLLKMVCMERASFVRIQCGVLPGGDQIDSLCCE